MKKSFTVLGIFILIAIAFLLMQVADAPRNSNNGTVPPPTPIGNNEETVVRMTADGFMPDKLTVAVGTTVVFVNEDTRDRWPASNIHPTHDIYPEFDPLNGIAPGDSWSFTFDKEGIWRMHDHLVPQFTGTVTVE